MALCLTSGGIKNYQLDIGIVTILRIIIISRYGVASASC